MIMAICDFHIPVPIEILVLLHNLETRYHLLGFFSKKNSSPKRNSLESFKYVVPKIFISSLFSDLFPKFRFIYLSDHVCGYFDTQVLCSRLQSLILDIYIKLLFYRKFHRTCMVHFVRNLFLSKKYFV